MSADVDVAVNDDASARAALGIVPGRVAASPDARRVRHEQMVARVFRRNYVALALDGGLFVGAQMFVNATTLLPAIIQSLGGPAWLIALSPSLISLGPMALPIFTAHWIEGFRRYKPLQLTTGIGQRLPFLLAGLALLVLHDHPTLVIVCVALAPLMSGVFGGLSVTGFQQLFIKVIPERRRSSLFAIRFTIAALLGIGAGNVAAIVLAGHPGLTGFGILHLCAFVMVMASWVAFAMIDEPATRQRGRPRSLTLPENLRAIPQLIAGNRQVVLFLGARFFRSGMFILLPFLAICFRDRLNRSDEFLAHLVIVQMIGAVLGNVAAGFIGDRFGSKVTMLVGTVLFAGLSAWSIVATTSLAFQAIFFLVGFAQNGAEVGNQALGLGVCPAANRSTILAVIALASLPSLLLASWISQRLWLAAGSGQRLTGLAIATVVALVLSAACLLPVRDPRHAPE